MDYIFHPFGTSLCYVDSDNEVVHFYGFVHIWTWFLLIWGILIMLHLLGMSLSTLWTYTVFGCGDFRGDGKHRVENWVENSVFHCFGKERKTWGENFLSWAHKFRLPKSGGKAWVENWWRALLHKCPLVPNGHNNLAKKKEDNFPTTNSA